MSFDFEMAALTKREEAELEGPELKRISLGVMQMDEFRNQHIRGTAQIGCFGDKVKEAKLIWTCADEGQQIYL